MREYPDGAGDVAAGLAAHDEGEPVALIFGPAQRPRAAHGEPPGERDRRPHPHPAPRVAPAFGLRPLAPPTCARVHAGGGRGPPSSCPATDRRSAHRGGPPCRSGARARRPARSLSSVGRVGADPRRGGQYRGARAPREPSPSTGGAPLISRLASLPRPISQRGPTWPETVIRSNRLSLYSLRWMSPPARSRQRLAPDPDPGLPRGSWYSPPSQAEMPMPEAGEVGSSSVKGRGTPPMSI